MATGVVLSRFVFVVDAGERGVVFNRIKGIRDKVYGEGMHFKIPFFDVSFLFQECLFIASEDLRSEIKTSNDSFLNRYQRYADCRTITETFVQTN